MVDIRVNVYRLGGNDPILRACCCCCGLFHTGVQVGDFEYVFAERAGIVRTKFDPLRSCSNTPATAVASLSARDSSRRRLLLQSDQASVDDFQHGELFQGEQPDYVYSIDMGSCSLAAAEIDDVLQQLRGEFTGENYHIYERNCNHFSDAFCQKLVHKNVPAYINRAAWCARWISRLMPQRLFLRGSGGGAATATAANYEERAAISTANSARVVRRDGAEVTTKAVFFPRASESGSLSASYYTRLFSGNGQRLGGGGGQEGCANAAEKTAISALVNSEEAGGRLEEPLSECSGSTVTSRRSPLDDEGREDARDAALATTTTTWAFPHRLLADAFFRALRGGRWWRSSVKEEEEENVLRKQEAFLLRTPPPVENDGLSNFQNSRAFLAEAAHARLERQRMRQQQQKIEKQVLQTKGNVVHGQTQQQQDQEEMLNGSTSSSSSRS